MERLKTCIGTISLVIIILLLSLDLVAFNENQYPKAFAKYHVYQTIDASPQEIDKTANNILLYIQSEEPLDTKLLNQKEILHLQDVQRLVTRGQQILLVSVLLFLALYLTSSEKKKILVYSSILTLGILAVFLLTNFSSLFVKFHELVFSNNYWLLNPATDNLIKMYPEEIFSAIFKKMIIVSAATAIVLLYISKKKNQPTKH